MARTAASARPLTDHDEIRRWAEERNATPSCVRRTGGGDDIGMIRLDFPGYSGEDSLEEISWDEWFEKFDEKNLALLVQDTTARGQQSNFNKLVSRDTAESRERSNGRGRRTPSSSGRSTGSRRSSGRRTEARAGGSSRSRSRRARTGTRSTSSTRGRGSRRSTARGTSSQRSEARGSRTSSRKARSTRASSTRSRRSTSGRSAGKSRGLRIVARGAKGRRGSTRSKRNEGGRSNRRAA